MADKKILITGASGFIGRNLAESFRERYEVFAPTHGELELTDDKAVRDYFNKRSFDAVVHCAVKPGHRNAKDLCDLFLLNTRKFFNIAANKSGFGKMITLSSGLVYDMRAYQPKMKEEYFGRSIPEDESGFSKYVCAKYIEKTGDIVELRPFGVYGKYEDYSIRFISNAICKVLSGMPVTLKQNRRFDYIHVDDLIGVVEYFIENKAGHKAYNVTPKNSVELAEIASKVVKLSGKDLPVKIAHKGMGPEYSGDSSRLCAEMGEFEKTPLDKGIEKLYRWYEENLPSIKKECLLADK